MKILKNTKLIALFLLISVAFNCFAFSTSAVAESYSRAYDDAELARFTEAIALEMGVPAENVKIDFASIRETSVAELSMLKSNSSSVNSVMSYNCCSRPPVRRSCYVCNNSWRLGSSSRL